MIDGIRSIERPSYVHDVAPISAPAKVTAVKTTDSHELSQDINAGPPLRRPPITQGELHQVKDHVVQRVVHSIKRHIPPHQFESNVRQLRKYIVHRRARALAANNPFRRYMRRLSKGSTAYELAMLYAITKLSDEDNELMHLGYTNDMLTEFISDHEQQLQAYLNIASVVEEYHGYANVTELLGAYETIVLTTNSVISALAASVRRFGVDKLNSWAPFLQRSAVADLVSQPQGGDKIHLMYILQELKNFRILNTLRSFLEKLQETRLKHIPLTQSMVTTLDMVEQPITTMNTVEKWVEACTHEEQILFFQDYRNLFNRISTEAYKNEEQQQNVKTVLQKKVDHLIYNYS